MKGFLKYYRIVNVMKNFMLHQLAINALRVYKYATIIKLPSVSITSNVAVY